MQNNLLPAFAPLEACVLRLRALFEQRGYQKADTPKFEEYTLYLDNKNFLGTDRILTFPDARGRLLALKPDVTLSIAKAVPDEELPLPLRLYYTDEVVRYSAENRAYQVQNQIGLEWIGAPDPFSGPEVLDLALHSLALIGEESAMDLSHLGFVTGLLEDAGLPPAVERDVLAAIHAKSIHGVAGILEAAGVENGRKERITALAGLHGPFAQVLERSKNLVRGERMEQAYGELAALNGAFASLPGQQINLDFSVVNDLDYYNGLIFRGYIKGIAGVACGGGRYDNLMQRLGKRGSAIGFAVYLHRLEGYFASYTRQLDVLLTYPPGCDCGRLLAMARELSARGLRVRCERADADLSQIAYSKLVRFEDWEEERPC